MFCLFIHLVSFFTLSSHASSIPLFEKQNPSLILPGYDESVNHSPAFYIWQNDPGLSEFYSKTFPDGSGTTDLCIPSSLSNILLYEYSQKKPFITNLKLPGISEDQKYIDGSKLVKGFLSNCDLTKTENITPLSASSCLLKFYHEAGYQNAKVKLIRNFGPVESNDGVEYIDRIPTIADLHQALKDGYEVSAAIAFMKWDAPSKTWIKTGSHAFNVFGYSANTADQDQKIIIYLSNPTRNYAVNFKDPISEIASLEVNSTLESMPSPYSNIEVKQISGRLLNFEGKTTFLAGLILAKPIPDQINNH